MDMSLRLAMSAAECSSLVNRRRGAQQFRCNYDMKNSKVSRHKPVALSLNISLISIHATHAAFLVKLLNYIGKC